MANEKVIKKATKINFYHFFLVWEYLVSGQHLPAGPELQAGKCILIRLYIENLYYTECAFEK